jgi:hypothetical protein
MVTRHLLLGTGYKHQAGAMPPTVGDGRVTLTMLLAGRADGRSLASQNAQFVAAVWRLRINCSK